MTTFNDYVKAVLDEKIIINCASDNHVKFLKELGAKHKFFDKKTWSLSCNVFDDKELANLLTLLRDEGFYFVGAISGWPPASVFSNLRQKGLVAGSIKEIMWDRFGKAMIREV